jgi:hypothetical protein
MPWLLACTESFERCKVNDVVCELHVGTNMSYMLLPAGTCDEDRSMFMTLPIFVREGRSSLSKPSRFMRIYPPSKPGNISQRMVCIADSSKIRRPPRHHARHVICQQTWRCVTTPSNRFVDVSGYSSAYTELRDNHRIRSVTLLILASLTSRMPFCIQPNLNLCIALLHCLHLDWFKL